MLRDNAFSILRVFRANIDFGVRKSLDTIVLSIEFIPFCKELFWHETVAKPAYAARPFTILF